MIETRIDHGSLFHYQLVSKMFICSLKVANASDEQTALQR